MSKITNLFDKILVLIAEFKEDICYYNIINKAKCMACILWGNKYSLTFSVLISPSWVVKNVYPINIIKAKEYLPSLQKYFTFHIPWGLFLQPNGPTITLIQQTFSYLCKSQNLHSPGDNSLRMGGKKVISFFFKNEENVHFS